MIAPILMFDLGGVLADLGSTGKSMGLDMADDDFWAIWLNSQSVYEFETGALSIDEFCRKFGRELAQVDDDFSKERFQEWNLRLFPETENLLRSLAWTKKLVLLSNTNEVHWNQVTKTSRIEAIFERMYLSHTTGYYKPAPDSFQNVVRDMNCSPTDISFFDDTAKNISAAKKLGINAHCVKGIEELEEALLAELSV